MLKAFCKYILYVNYVLLLSSIITKFDYLLRREPLGFRQRFFFALSLQVNVYFIIILNIFKNVAKPKSAAQFCLLQYQKQYLVNKK